MTIRSLSLYLVTLTARWCTVKFYKAKKTMTLNHSVDHSASTRFEAGTCPWKSAGQSLMLTVDTGLGLINSTPDTKREPVAAHHLALVLRCFSDKLSIMVVITLLKNSHRLMRPQWNRKPAWVSQEALLVNIQPAFRCPLSLQWKTLRPLQKGPWNRSF